MTTRPERFTERPIFDALPSLVGRVPWVKLGELPTPVERLGALTAELGRSSVPFHVKRDDLSAPIYGGNKVRTLEVLFARAKAKGARRIWATGAFGSNHAVATVLHAPRVGLEGAALLFPQPRSAAARENLEATLGAASEVRSLFHWSALPFGMWRVHREGRGADDVMDPGGAVPEGALGYVSGALELAEQVEAGLLPCPRHLVIGVGSTCTTAGLLVGFELARRLGRLPFTPRLHAIRVTPWPVTSALRIVSLAHRTAALLAELAGDGRWAFGRRELASALHVNGRYLGGGYGVPTDAGREAIMRFEAAHGLPLDTTYSAKSAAAALDLVRDGQGPVVYWATKSTAPLPAPSRAALDAAPARMRRWLSS